MLEKILKYRNHPWVLALHDVRVIGFLVFGVIVLLVSWSTVGVIQTNYELQKKIAKQEQENQVTELQNNNLKLRNEYYNSDQYLELSARKLGMAAPGERVYNVPQSVALKHTVDMKAQQEKEQEPAGNIKPLYQQNLEAWRNFFFQKPAR